MYTNNCVQITDRHAHHHTHAHTKRAHALVICNVLRVWNAMRLRAVVYRIGGGFFVSTTFHVPNLYMNKKAATCP